MKTRLQWVTAWIHVTAEIWGGVVWSEVSEFDLFLNWKRRLLVRQPPIEVYSLKWLQIIVKFSGKIYNGVGCYSINGVRVLHRLIGIRRKTCIYTFFKTFFSQVQWHFVDWTIFPNRKMILNIPPTKLSAFFTTLYDFSYAPVAARDWPSRSPGLNPIKQL